jgi:hypothetical protein
VFYKDCKIPDIEWEIGTIVISPAHGSVETFVKNVRKYLSNNEISNELQRYPHMEVNDVHKFDTIPLEELRIMNNIRGRMDRITSLDISLLSSKRIYLFVWFPSIRLAEHSSKFKLNQSSNVVIDKWILSEFSTNCLHLQKVTWNNKNKFYSAPNLNGHTMRFTNNVKEIIMDDSLFCVHEMDERMSNLEYHRDMFIFHRCSMALERVSIRSAK